MLTAIEFGEKYESCEEAMIWRRSLPNGTTQAEAYLVCPRGDWLIWQLTRNCVDADEIELALDRALEKIVARAIRRCVRSLRGNNEPWAKEYRRWARCWLMGEDRSASEYATTAEFSTAKAYVHTSAYVASRYFCAGVYIGSYADVDVYADAGAATNVFDCYAEASSAQKKELKRQACDSRSEIPTWQGE